MGLPADFEKISRFLKKGKRAWALAGEPQTFLISKE
jgi:hypothetical protein